MSETKIDMAAEVVESETVPGAGTKATAGAAEVTLDVQMPRLLADQARDQGLELTGEGGLLQ
jgi:hypothetical protein